MKFKECQDWHYHQLINILNGYWKEQKKFLEQDLVVYEYEKEGILWIKDGIYLRDELDIIKYKYFKEIWGDTMSPTPTTTTKPKQP